MTRYSEGAASATWPSAAAFQATSRRPSHPAPNAGLPCIRLPRQAPYGRSMRSCPRFRRPRRKPAAASRPYRERPASRWRRSRCRQCRPPQHPLPAARREPPRRRPARYPRTGARRARGAARSAESGTPPGQAGGPFDPECRHGRFSSRHRRRKSAGASKGPGLPSRTGTAIESVSSRGEQRRSRAAGR